MNAPTTIDEVQKELASIANTFEKISHPKWTELLPFTESIAELRKKHASFKTITTILCKKSISVSHDTVARFYYAIIEQKPKKRRTRRAASKDTNKSTANRGQHISKKAKPAPKPIQPLSQQERGPRIARIEDL